MGRLDEKTTISFGLILMIVAAFGAVAGVAGTAIWWSATIQADVTALKVSTDKVANDHETRLRAVEMKLASKNP